MPTKTRFRAYQLGNAGSSFSYSVDNHFTLIEARINEVNCPNIIKEMEIVGCSTIDCLHITSWDQDHCSFSELELILKYLKPIRIEYPGYNPHTDCGKQSLQAIKNYANQNSITINEVSPEYINALKPGVTLKYNDILYNPIEISDNSNNNSIVQLFRRGRFSVLSLGDCEDDTIAKRIMNGDIAKETDVLILAHHGADNGFTTREFIQHVKPKIAICSSNYDNQFEHPKQSIRDMLFQEGVTLYTTKTGDVVIICNEDNKVDAYNLISNSEKVSSKITISPKCQVPSKR